MARSQSWGILSGRFLHEAASARAEAGFPRRFACSVRKLGTSNSSSTEWWTNQSIAAAVATSLIPLDIDIDPTDAKIKLLVIQTERRS